MHAGPCIWLGKPCGHASHHPPNLLPLLTRVSGRLSAAHIPIQNNPCPSKHTHYLATVSNLRDGAGYIFSSFMEAAGFTAGRVRAYTGAAANLASSVSEAAHGFTSLQIDSYVYQPCARMPLPT